MAVTEVEPEELPDAPPSSPRTGPDWLSLAGLAVVYAVSVLVYSLLARKQAIPNLIPDEIFYGKLSQGLAFGDGREWRNAGFDLPPLWTSVLSLAWHGSVPDGYATAKTLGAFIVSTTVVPTWLLARTYVGPRLALLPAALVVMGVWMQVSDFLASENLAFPLATASLAFTVAAVRDTRLRWVAWSLAFAALAVLTRTQMLVLPVILVLALIGDVLRRPRADWRGRIDERPRVLWIGLVAAVVIGLLAFVVKPSLTNYDVLANHASIGDIVSTTFHQGVGSIAYFAFVPVVATLALMARKENWRDENVGALLVTIVAAAIVTYPVSGRFLAWATDGVPVDRYSMYLAPLLVTGLVVAPGRITKWPTLIAAGVVGLLMIGAAKIGNFLEQGGIYGIQKALFDNGVGSGGLKAGVVVVALIVSTLAALALTNRRRASLGLAAAAVLMAAVMVAQNYAARSYEYDVAKANRALYIPPQLDWVDRAADGEVATLDVGKDVPLRANSVIYTEFFNKKIKSYYSTIATGSGCDIDLGKDGGVKHGDSKCGKGWPRNWVIAEGPITAVLKGQKVLATSRASGTLVRTPAGAPKLLSLVGPPCTGYGCTGQFQMGVYLDKPSRVTVAFGPGRDEHHVQVTQDDVRTLPAGKPVNLNFKLPAGSQAASIPVDWTDPDGAPALEAVTVTTADGRTLRIY